MLVETCHARLRPWPARRQGSTSDRLDDASQVLGGGAAAAADQGQSELGHELHVGGGELVGRERVVSAIAGQLRQAGVRHGRDRHPGVLGQVAQVLAHLRRAGGAVQPDRVDPERLQRGERGADLAAQQHGAGRLDRHLHEHGQVLAGVRQGPPRADHGGLGLQQVLRRLDQEGVDAAGAEPGRLALVGVAQGPVRDLPQGRQLGARTHRADHEAGLLRGGPGVGRVAREACPGERQLLDAVGDAVLAQVGQVRAEGVRLDRVDADGQVVVVDLPDDVRSGHVEDLVAPLVALEGLDAGVRRLQHRAHRPVGDEHLGVEQRAEQVGAAAHGGPSVGT